MTISRTILTTIALISSLLLIACEGEANVNSGLDIDIEDTQPTQSLVPTTGLSEDSAVSTITENSTVAQSTLEPIQIDEHQVQVDDIEELRSELQELKEQIQNNQLVSDYEELQTELNELKMSFDQLNESVLEREACLYEIGRGVSIHRHRSFPSYEQSNLQAFLHYTYSDFTDESAVELMQTGISPFFWHNASPKLYEILEAQCDWDFPELYGFESIRELGWSG
jgi:cell fate (sporulation/competence/biofilm development) regulator YlbF (YheA/YmcA/DUF963 family)